MAKVKVKKGHAQLFSEIEKKTQRGLWATAITLQSEIKQTLSTNPSPSLPGTAPGVRTGALRRSIQIDGSDISQNKIRVGTNLIYAKIQEFGGVIRAKFAKVLKFQINNEWKSKESVILPPRPFLRPSYRASKNTMIDRFKAELNK